MPDFYAGASVFWGVNNGNGIARFREFGHRLNPKQRKLACVPV
jgi:hypothetical protein